MSMGEHLSQCSLMFMNISSHLLLDADVSADKASRTHSLTSVAFSRSPPGSSFTGRFVSGQLRPLLGVGTSKTSAFFAEGCAGFSLSIIIRSTQNTNTCCCFSFFSADWLHVKRGTFPRQIFSSLASPFWSS